MGLLNAPDALCLAGGVIVELFRCSSRIPMALLLSRKRCALQTGRRRFLAPATGKERTQVPFLLHLSPDRQPKAVHDVFVGTKASAKLLRNTLIKVGHDGAKPFNLYPS